MSSTVTTHRPGAGNGTQRFSKWSGLQPRMTLSYVWVTIMLVLVFLALAWLAFVVVATTIVAPYVYTLSARNVAQRYALAAALQAEPSGLNPNTTFLPDRPGSLTLPGISSSSDDAQIPYMATDRPGTQRLAFALLITPDGHVLASSYPSRYPAATSVAVLLPERTRLIPDALAGTASSGSDSKGIYAVEPVWNRERQPVGAIYVQLPGSPAALDALGQRNWLSVLPSLLVIGVVLLVLITPIGGLFGLMTTRGVVRRIRQLAAATTEFAAGDYSQRVPISRRDEVGDLAQHFNRMAEQLAASIATQRKLTEENARLAEREHISRELHDAISQDLFSLRMLAGGLESAVANGTDLHPYLETLEQATDGMLRDMRALLLELRPLQLEEVGLAQALENLALTYRTRLGINVRAEVQAVSLSEPAEQALFRIAQEALTNAVRHAEATAVTLVLQASSDQVEFVIRDNGKGFEPMEAKSAAGLGLHLMHERVEEIGGQLSILSAPGAGTQITISIPTENQA